ncbi:helix-turn-helix transcriptional regulator [Staphylococcus warneri]|uniref:helix-turn-helix domain-containing protein n=1 Tax=Staphylococcus warneri TaxID=1292 RepID=UPI000D95B6DB|nr:AraC family transcriptional regulator [Staphylococcus warneri]PXX86000.1 AraC family transcriptional regulator [Staphylococcus warneri]QJX56726.1 helix-turn-helix transcriptional regulator [Staphylococcus warneri]
MPNSYLRILSNVEYPTTRCQDGIILFWPLESDMHVQKFRKQMTINNDIYIINNADVFSVNTKGRMIMLYLTSDWFTEQGFSFFEFQYTSNLIKSSNLLKDLILQLALKRINYDNQEMLDQLTREIVQIIGTEAVVDKDIAVNQYNYTYYDDLKEELDYIDNHIETRLTLKDISTDLFISKSNISSQFHQLIGMGFKRYVDTLKISKSIEMLLTTSATISHISDTLGFSNMSTFSKMFKGYLGVTPNDYRKLSKYDKNVMFKVNIETDEDIETFKTYVEDLVEQHNIEKYEDIQLDVGKPNKIKPFHSIIQIQSIEEIRFLFLYDKFEKYDFSRNDVIFYIVPTLTEICDVMTYDDKRKIAELIIEKGLRVAFNIDNYRVIDHLGICFNDAVLKLKNAKKTITHEYEVISVFNLDEKEIREVYRDIIKFQDLHINHVIALDMTCLLDDPVLLKSIESQIKRLKFEYLFIDNAKLKTSYLIDENERLLLKNEIQLKNLKAILNEIDFVKEKMILLNVENHQLINDKDNDLSNSAPLIIETISTLRETFAGLGFNLYDHTQLFNTLHLFDKNGFKTTFGLIFNELTWLFNQEYVDASYYKKVELEDRYVLCLYDWRIIENEATNENYEDSHVFVSFDQTPPNKSYFIFIGKINRYSGNLNHLIAKDLRNKYDWTSAFLDTIDYYFKPMVEEIEHDFTEKSLDINLSYNSFYMITIFKNESKIKRAWHNSI